jgi:hypothetical protein
MGHNQISGPGSATLSTTKMASNITLLVAILAQLSVSCHDPKNLTNNWSINKKINPIKKRYTRKDWSSLNCTILQLWTLSVQELQQLNSNNGNRGKGWCFEPKSKTERWTLTDNTNNLVCWGLGLGAWLWFWHDRCRAKRASWKQLAGSIVPWKKG